MEYLLAVIALLAIVFLTTILSGFFKILVPIAYIWLGYTFGAEYHVIGAGAAIGAGINIVNVRNYIRSYGSMSSAPSISIIASLGLIVSYLVGLFFGNSNVDSGDQSSLLGLLGVSIAIVVLWVYLSKKRSNSIEDFKESVVSYKIVRKYEDEPSWATYLYTKDGGEGWNETIPGSFAAKDPSNDLTFVHYTKEEAENYASMAFVNAEYLE